MQKVLFVGLGGFIGSILRYLMSLAAPKYLGTELPYGTLLVNVIGGLLIGLVMEISLKSPGFSPELKLFLTTGIMGGFTTFSTFSYETILMFSGGSYFKACLNIGLNLILSLGAVLFGKGLPRFFGHT